MMPSVKQFDRGDHIVEIETTAARDRIVRRIPKDAKAPSLVRKVGNFAKASVKHVAAGRPQATDEQVAERFAICQACKLFTPTGEGEGTCNHASCGCSLKAVGVSGLNKLRWQDQACPIGKWKRITAT